MGRGRFPGTCYVAVGAWLVFWAPCGRCGGVALPMGSVFRRGGVAGFLCPMRPPWGLGRFAGPRVAAVGALPVSWALCGGRGGVPGPLSPVWMSWGRGRFSGPRVAAVGA